MYRKPNKLIYRFTQTASWLVSKLFFKCKQLRNELKGKKGPIVVIANHQCALDFMNLICTTKTPMNFVISNSFYSTLPLKKPMDKIGVIPKQQFQTSLQDMKDMKAVIDNGGILAIYPAGLMCEDGLSTPIPTATYRFLQWMRADVYVAKTSGTYFVTPKWSDKSRRGRTYMDIYRLATGEELGSIKTEVFRDMCEKALLFDAYREQEELRVKYKGGDCVEGLENVLYMCPHCKSEFTVKAKDRSVLCCEACGFEVKSDEYGLLRKTSEIGEEIRYVSDWSRMIHDSFRKALTENENFEMTEKTKFHMINGKKHKFLEVGEGEITVNRRSIILHGKINGEELDRTLSIAAFPSLPFKPGKYLEVQDGNDIYRCMLEDGRQAQKLINAIKILHELSEEKSSH